ncbi:MAG: aspartate/glutamate racemase family protein [Planctomycetota bacterium]
MKTIGLIGGMSWESSAVYYQLLNERVRDRIGGMSSCPCLLHSVDFAEIAHLQHEGDWKTLSQRMAEYARRLEDGGAECIVLCTNTMHVCWDALESASTLPKLHIAAATGEVIARQGFTRVGLLGTRFTMEQRFYADLLSEKFGIETRIPDDSQRGEVHRIIYDELVRGVVREESKRVLLDVVESMRQHEVQGLILGCTELPLLLKTGNVSNEGRLVPLWDTTSIHVDAALAFAMDHPAQSSCENVDGLG